MRAGQSKGRQLKSKSESPPGPPFAKGGTPSDGSRAIAVTGLGWDGPWLRRNCRCRNRQCNPEQPRAFPPFAKGGWGDSLLAFSSSPAPTRATPSTHPRQPSPTTPWCILPIVLARPL
ncbi:hypothetical protein AZ78_2042 [Lysobacter capsici AZ78]|uniref:Uncharacterized protein n=1 Tax=Lysobacter capsici AZ78 TaxID=1444315 RepID=A0A120AGF3_9GAMM|nr:hypothetical protein AZ78_2042 [Lysobacter capsici AZ78]